MDTKLKADIAESAVITELLKRGFKVLRPVGDRLPYDLAIDIEGRLIKIHVKSTWFYKGAYKIACGQDCKIVAEQKNRYQKQKPQPPGLGIGFGLSRKHLPQNSAAQNTRPENPQPRNITGSGLFRWKVEGDGQKDDGQCDQCTGNKDFTEILFAG